jgi:outer membrane immunogenic protein
MRNKLIGLLAVVVGAGVAPIASAADLPVKAAPAAVVAYNWAGFYIGGHIGFAWGDNRMTDIDGFSSVVGNVTQYSSDGIIGGGQIGANWQTGWFVFGVEGDISATGAAGSTNRVDPVAFDETAHTRYSWVATIRGRLGVAFDRTLIYASGGVAFASIRNELSDTDGAVFDPDDSFSSRSTRTGWVAGGGIEYAFAGNWTARVEGLYMDFGDRTYVVDIGGGTNSRFNVNNTLAVVRFGLNYKFGGPAVVARY